MYEIQYHDRILTVEFESMNNLQAHQCEKYTPIKICIQAILTITKEQTTICEVRRLIPICIGIFDRGLNIGLDIR